LSQIEGQERPKLRHLPHTLCAKERHVCGPFLSFS
jgi:hypothetical protein